MNVTPLSVLRPAGTPPAFEAARPANADARAGAAERKKVAGQFEAVLIRQLLGPTMSSMLGQEGGAASDVYGDLLTDAVAQQLSAGQGLGLGRVIAQQLAPRTPSPVSPPASP